MTKEEDLEDKLKSSEEYGKEALHAYLKLEKKYDTSLRENTGLKIHNAYVEKKLIEGREVVLSLYNAIRDYLMITNDETFDRLSEAINDKRIEKFIEDAEKFIKEEIENLT